MDLRRFSIYLNYFKVQVTLQSTQAKAPSFLHLSMQTPSLTDQKATSDPVPSKFSLVKSERSRKYLISCRIRRAEKMHLFTQLRPLLWALVSCVSWHKQWRRSQSHSPKDWDIIPGRSQAPFSPLSIILKSVGRLCTQKVQALASCWN